MAPQWAEIPTGGSVPSRQDEAAAAERAAFFLRPLVLLAFLRRVAFLVDLRPVAFAGAPPPRLVW